MRTLLVLSTFVLAAQCGPALAHEPVWGLGPHTIYRHGIGLEVGLEGKRAGGETETVYQNELIYGVTEDFSVTLVTPFIQQGRSSIGDMVARAKYRFHRRDTIGASFQQAAVGGIKLPTGTVAETGSGSTDYMFGYTVGRESRRDYFFADLRYRINSEANGRRRGNLLNYDVAFGLRPKPTGYYQPDLVLLLEMNGSLAEQSEFNGVPQRGSGGHTVFVSPGFLYSKRNVMWKGGLQIPLIQPGTADLGINFTLAVEVHS